MNYRHLVSILGSALILPLALMACASGDESTDDSGAAISSASKKSGSDAGAPRTDAGPVRTDGGAVGTDGGSANPTAYGSGTVTLDGTPCQIPSDAEDAAGLDIGLNGNGWQMQLSAICGTQNIILKVSGTIDAPYPQTDPVPFLDEEGAALVVSTNGSETASEFGTASGGTSLVTAGPTSTTKARVTGSATVASSDGSSSDVHQVTYDVAF